MIESPFDVCPEYETDHFVIKKVMLEDAPALLDVYSDSQTRLHMNNDNCGGEWQCDSIDVIEEGIRSWDQAFDQRNYIRWSIHLKESNKTIGTIELAPVPGELRFFDGACSTGILRIDLKSDYETEAIFTEIYKMTNNDMIEVFGIEKIVTKGLDDDHNRLTGLSNSKYHRLADYEILPFSNYYISYKW